VIELNRAFLARALESVRGARIEYDGGRHNNSVNRSYYACFQAAIFALQMDGIQAFRGDWGHDFVQSQFNGLLINRRHLYSPELRTTLPDNYELRRQADYAVSPVAQVQVLRALRRAERFVAAIVRRYEEQS
jgi:uncharacterized protein (UPF0332 family)